MIAALGTDGHIVYARAGSQRLYLHISLPVCLLIDPV